MMRDYTPDQLIDKLNKSDPFLKKLYTRGSCYQFALLLKSFYPEGEIYIRTDKKHTGLMINNVLYDISGRIGNVEDFALIKPEETIKCERWSSDRNLIVIEKKHFKMIEKKLNKFNHLSCFLYSTGQLLGLGLIYFSYEYLKDLSNPEFKWFVIVLISISILWMQQLKKSIMN